MLHREQAEGGCKQLNITVLGAGNGGTAMAADMKRKGHRVTLLKTSKSVSGHFNKLLETQGKIKVCEGAEEYEVTLDCVTDSFSEALTDATELVIIFIQTNYHQRLINRIRPYLHDGEIVLLEPGYLSTLYLEKVCGGLELTIVEAESSPLDCRVTAPGEVSILFRNVRNPVAVFPKRNAIQTLKALKPLGYHFVLLQSTVEAALHNPNLIVHTVGAIMSIPRIEYSGGEYWMYKEVFTESIWNLIGRLDAEKLDILGKLQLPRLSYLDACRFRNAEDLTCDSKQVFEDYARNSSTKGPFISNSRYITEDVPEGLVLLESMGRMLAVKTEICTALIDLSSACLQRNFRREGRTVDRLGYRRFQMLLREQA